MKKMNPAEKVELLAPAGNLEKLKIAFIYGADAVYIGGKNYSLRAQSDNFTIQEMMEGIEYAKRRGKKVYLTLNAIPHNADMEGLETYIKEIADIGLGAIIVADPGVFALIKEAAPKMEIHISTQANNTNYRSVKFWKSMGASRVVLARELSLDEITEISSKTKGELEIECFVHGAMCISYSGRCLLSTYMAGRDANQGACAQPCRWKYHVVEEKRSGEYFPVEQDEKGTYIYNSKDLCMLPYISEVIAAGVKSLKLEGRMKSAFYVATVVGAYRRVLDDYYEDPQNYVFDHNLMEEDSKASHREYTTGFYFNKPDGSDRIFSSSSYVRSYDFIGIVLEYDETTKMAKIEQRNRMFKGDEIEVLIPGAGYFGQRIEIILDKNLLPIDIAPHAQMIVYMKMEKDVVVNAILRKKES